VDISYIIVLTMTELYFCNVCQQSVPQIKLDIGDAIRHGKRIICADCADTLVMATELEPAKKEWGISPLVIIFFMMTWASFAYMYMDQQNFIATMQNSQTDITAENRRLSATLAAYKRALSSEMGDSSALSAMARDGIEKDVEEKHHLLRDALARQAISIEDLSGSPQRITVLERQQGLNSAELESIAESAREIRVGQQVLRDEVTSLKRDFNAAPAPIIVEESSFAAGVKVLIENLSDSDPNIRFSALEEIANHNDPNLVLFVAPLLQDSYEFCRYQAATTLRQWSALSAVPQLIEALDDSFEFVRKEVNVALEAITKESVGYNHKNEEAKRLASQQAWRDWSIKNGF
jgi:hypothetical protein